MRSQLRVRTLVASVLTGLLAAFAAVTAVRADTYTFDLTPPGAYLTTPDAEIVFGGSFYEARVKPRIDWLDATHQRRLRIEIDNPGPALVDYPIAVSIDGSAAPYFFAYVKEPAGGDIVVTTSDGLTTLPTWVEELRSASSPLSCPNASRVLTGKSGVTEPVTTLDAKTLVYRVDENQYTVTFAGTSLTLAQIVSQINGHGGPLRARAHGALIQLLLPEGFQPYDWHFEIVSGTEAMAALKLSIGQFSTDYVHPVTSGVGLPCALIWFRAPLIPTGQSTFYAYYDDVFAGPPAPDAREQVFSLPLPAPTHVLLSDRQSAADLLIASFASSAFVRVDSFSLYLETALGSNQSVIVPSSLTDLGSFVISDSPITGLYGLETGDVLQPLSTAAREFHFPVAGNLSKTDAFFFFALEADVRVELEEWRFDIGPLTSTKVKSQTVDLLAGQRQTVNFDVAAPSVVTIRTSCPPAAPLPCLPPRIVAFYRGSIAGVYVDGMPLLPPMTDAWGVRTSELLVGGGHRLTPWVAGVGPTTSVLSLGSDMSTPNLVLRVGQVYDSAVFGDKNGKGPAFHLNSTLNGRRFTALQTNDGTGVDGTPLMRYFDLGRRFLIPRAVSYVAIATTEANTTCRLRYGSCTVTGDCPSGSICVDQRCEQQLTSSSVSYPTPGKLVFGETRSYNSCALPVDCDATLSCVGATTCGCTSDAQCNMGQVCSSNRCIYPLDVATSNNVDTSSGLLSVGFNVAIELTCTKRVWAMVDDAVNGDESVLLSPKSVRPVPPAQPPVGRNDPNEELQLPSTYEMVTTPEFVPPGPVMSWDGFTAGEVWSTGLSEVRYQLGVGGNFYYYNSGAGEWQLALSPSDSNLSFEVASNISNGWTFGTPQSMSVRIVLRSTDGATNPKVFSVALDYTPQLIGPDLETPDVEEDGFIEPPDLGEPDLGLDDGLIEPPDLGEPDLGEPDLGLDDGLIEPPDLGEPDLGLDDGLIEPPDLGEPDLGLDDVNWPPLPVSLEILPIADQVVGQDFQITVRALDGFGDPLLGFNETVNLTFPNSSLSPDMVVLVDGVGTATVNVGLPTLQMWIHASYLHPSNVQLETDSNAFDVTAGPLAVVFVPNGASSQPSPVNTVLPLPFVVQVSEGPAPAPGKLVTFRVVQGSAYVHPTENLTEISVLSDPNGQASVLLRTGGQVGPVLLEAQAGSSTAQVQMNVTLAPPFLLEIDAPNKTVPIGMPMPQPLTVTLKEINGTPVVNQTVQIQFYEFLTNLAGPGISYIPNFQLQTNGSGQAQFQASFSTPGLYYVIAIAPAQGISARLDGFEATLLQGDLIAPDVDQPDLDQGDLVQPDLDQGDLVQPDLDQGDLVQPDLDQGDTSSSDTTPQPDTLGDDSVVGPDQSGGGDQSTPSVDLSNLRFVGGGGCTQIAAPNGDASALLLLLLGLALLLRRFGAIRAGVRRPRS